MALKKSDYLSTAAAEYAGNPNARLFARQSWVALRTKALSIVSHAGEEQLSGPDLELSVDELVEIEDRTVYAAEILAKMDECNDMDGDESECGGDAPGDGKKPYGNVPYGDPGYRDGKKRYPISSPEKIRAAWNYIHQKKNAAKYTPAQLARIKARIISAWKKHISKDGPPSAKEE